MTLVLVTLNILAYGLELASGGQAFCTTYGLVPARGLEGLFTYGFLHDPQALLHIAGNMAFLAVFGAVVEGALGGLGLLVLYGLAGVAGGLFHVLVDPSSTLPLVGASGAVFGVLAVAAVVRPRLLGFALAFGGVEVWHALAGGGGSGGGVSFGCHLGGLVAGVLVAGLLRATGSEALEAA
jgi:membrane associated rhomboid family serine protease